MKMLTVVVGGLIGALAGVAPAAAIDASGGSAIVEGFARYQAARVETLVLNEFAYSLADDRLMRKFLPSAGSAVRNYKGISGQRLLPIIRAQFAEDIERISDVGKQFGAFGDTLAIELRNSTRSGEQSAEAVATAWVALATLYAFVSEADGERTTIDLLADMNALKALQPRLPSAPGGGTPKALNVSELTTDTGALANVERLATVGSVDKARILGVLEKFTSSTTSLRSCLVKDEVEPQCVDRVVRLVERLIDGGAPKLKALLSAVDALREEFSSSERQYALVAHHLFSAMIALDANTQATSFFEFQSGVLFLAEVVDTANAQKTSIDARAASIEGLIAAFVDEEAAHNMKRLPSTNAFEATGWGWKRWRGVPYYWASEVDVTRCRLLFICRNSIFLGSAFGAAYAYLDEDAPDARAWGFRSYGPVGIELKLATFNDFPLTLMYAPIDVGAYITQELKDEEYSAEFADVVAPSVALSISGRRRPFSLMVGYQDGIRVDEERETHALFLAFVFDLPLLRLF